MAMLIALFTTEISLHFDICMVNRYNKFQNLNKSNSDEHFHRSRVLSKNASVIISFVSPFVK